MVAQDKPETFDLGALAGPSPEEFLQSLPLAVRNRVYALKTYQAEFNKIHEKLLAEQRELEAKYEKQFAPLYEERRQIVAGEREPTEAELKDGTPEGTEVPPAGVEDKKGVSDFWFKVLSTHETISETIEERDEDCLKYLRDVKHSTLEDPLKGFKLEFTFDENPYFDNKVLTKVYNQAEEDGDIILENAQGCTINWKQGKNLTVIVRVKKQKHKDGKKKRTHSKQEPCDSFFNFFKPPEMPSADDDDDDENDEIEEIEEALEADYDLGQEFVESLIPRAVDWYTGRCVVDPDDEDEEEEDDEEEEEEEEEPVKPPPKKGKGKGKGGAKGGGGGKSGGGDGAAGGKDANAENPECKQQ